MIQTQMLDKYGMDREELNQILEPEKKEKSFYLKRLPDIDNSFRKFYRGDMDMDMYNNPVVSKPTREVYYNKIILAARYYLFCKEKGIVTNESNLYLGSWMLYNMADGNPRSLYNIISAISSMMEIGGKLKMNIPALRNLVREQSEKAMVERFSSYPMPLIHYEGQKLSYDDILARIGEFFRKELLSYDYNPKPRTMFTVENKSQFRNFIHVALEVGAIVSVEDKSKYEGRQPNGVYRLTYMLYPYFEYVDVVSKEVATLEEIISNSEK